MRPFALIWPAPASLSAQLRNSYTANASRIVSVMADKLKSGQAEGIVLDLSETSVRANALGNIPARLRGIGVDMSKFRSVVVMP